MTAEFTFERDHSPIVGEVEHLDCGLRVVTAGNGGPMTYTGTRSYLLGHGDVALIDPGPTDEEHFQGLLASLGPDERISHVFITHSHLDHSGLSSRVAAHYAADTYGFGDWKAGRSAVMQSFSAGVIGGGEGVDLGFFPDHCLKDGDVVSTDDWSLEVLHTPGHMGNHLCFASAAQNALFSGDHVMGWSTTLVSPPDGDLTQFMASLQKLTNRAETKYFPGHGAPVEAPAKAVAHLIDHRRSREAQILQCMDYTGQTLHQITGLVYRELPAHLHQAASRNVLAHLIDLYSKGVVSPKGALNADAEFVIGRAEI